jgi:hypothetical protein
MKKVIKKSIAKAPVKKTVAKKPMMKMGGAKKSLPKAQTGTQVKEGPLSEEDTKKINTKSKNTNPNFGPAPYLNDETPFVDSKKKWLESIARTQPTFNTSKVNLKKKGGAVKKMAKGGSTFGMLSVKAGIDKNPKPTAADRIAGATKNKKKMGGVTKLKKK